MRFDSGSACVLQVPKAECLARDVFGHQPVPKQSSVADAGVHFCAATLLAPFTEQDLTAKLQHVPVLAVHCILVRLPIAWVSVRAKGGCAAAAAAAAAPRMILGSPSPWWPEVLGCSSLPRSPNLQRRHTARASMKLQTGQDVQRWLSDVSQGVL